MHPEQELGPRPDISELTDTGGRNSSQGTEPEEKGSLRAMWEVLMQLRVLLPYLSRLVPLLDRGLVKAAPDLSELHKDMQQIQAGHRQLAEQFQERALQLERIEEVSQRLREFTEREVKESRNLSERLDALTSWVRGLAILILALLAAVIAFAVMFWPHGRY
jgi:hypothetical protein